MTWILLIIPASTLICILLYKVYFKVEVYNLHLFKWATWVSVYFNLFYSTRFLKTHLEQWTNRLTFSAFYTFLSGLRSVRSLFFIALSLWFALIFTTNLEHALDVNQLTAAGALFSMADRDSACKNLKEGLRPSNEIAILGLPRLSNDVDSDFWSARGVVSIDLEPIMFAPGFCATDVERDMAIFHPDSLFVGYVQDTLPDKRIKCLLLPRSDIKDIVNTPDFLDNAYFYIRPARPDAISVIKSVMLGTEGPQFNTEIREQVCNAVAAGEHSDKIVTILSELEIIRSFAEGNILLINARPVAFGPGYDASKLKQDLVISGMGLQYTGLIWDIRANGDVRCFLIYNADNDLSKIPIAIEKEDYLWVWSETATPWSNELVKHTRDKLLQPLVDRWGLQ